LYKLAIDGRVCFSVRKPWLTAEKPGDNHVFKLRDDFALFIVAPALTLVE
jgi:hypothetical protein